ncbi:3753_t:CDS:2, partial [Dentiscutata heterogama]
MQDVQTIIFVCYNLPPSDLLAMVCVCKYFKNILDESINPLAKEIWRNSRISFTIFQNKEPPSGMSQQNFARLLTFEKGCQFCKTKEKPLTIYWIPGVRSCSDCMFPKTSSFDILRPIFMIDDEILGLIVPVTPSIDLSESPHYWNDHVKNTIAFFMNADDNKRRALNSLREYVRTKYNEAQNYAKWMFNLRKIYLLGLFSRIHGEISDETLFKMREYYEYRNLKIEIKYNPFLVQDWQQYKSRILQIAQGIDMNPANTNFPSTLVPPSENIQKQKMIVKRLKKLTYGSEGRSLRRVLSIRHILYKYLPICPSFVNPPGRNKCQKFFECKLLPVLIEEANQLYAARAVPPPYFLKVDGALKVGSLRRHPVFECRLCSAFAPSDVKKIRDHFKYYHNYEDNVYTVLFLAK